MTVEEDQPIEEEEYDDDLDPDLANNPPPPGFAAMMTSILNSKLLGKENLLLVDGLESISLNGLEDENAL